MNVRRGALLLLLFFLLPARALAGPLLAPHPGGLGFFGPTDPEPTAVWWNAAALGELDGTQFYAAGTPVFLSQQLNRDGKPGVDRLDLNPDPFGAFTTDFGTEHV